MLCIYIAKFYIVVLVRLKVQMYIGNGNAGELLGAQVVGFGSIIHVNIFDQLHGIVSVPMQRRRASQADVSVKSFDELIHILTK